MPMTSRSLRQDTGTTLTELLISMVVMGIFVAVFGGITVRIFESVGNQQARSDNLDSTRLLVQTLDRQVRYADAINAPVTVGGSRYVTWRAFRSTGTSGASTPQLCYQWRVTAGRAMQYRQWAPGTTSATTWRTVGTGIDATGSTDIFSISPDLSQARQQLTLTFTSTHGVTAVGTPSRVAFTALNSSAATVPATPVCQEVAPT